MFNRNKITAEDMKMIQPTSKMALKMSCVMMTDGDIDKAERIYDFFVKDMQIPDNDPVKPTTMGQLKETASSLFNFYKDNQEDIVQGVAMIRSMFGRGAAAPAPPQTNIPEIPKD